VADAIKWTLAAACGTIVELRAALFEKEGAMFRRKRTLRVDRALTILIALASWGTTLLGAEQKRPAFKFTKVDLSLYDQPELLDTKPEREGMVYHDENLEAYLNEVGRAVVPAGPAPERVQWKFLLARDPLSNAFALPNGSVYVNTGLNSLLENGDQLAAVLAHEITQVTERHTYLHFRDYRKKAAISNIVSYVGAMVPSGSAWGAPFKLAAATLPSVMVASINGYGRELEREADTYSFDKLTAVNYEPREIANTFRLLERKDEVDVATIYYISSSPSAIRPTVG
jgi:predicted Zn-dependent protease